MKLVIVESPAKAKTIGKYLGKDYEVVASFGHIRDLPSKAGSVVPDEDFLMHYEISPRSKAHVKTIADAAKRAEIIYLATDPDREGEAISWHVIEALKEKKALKKATTVKRVVFNEITKKAVTDAVQNPRDINDNLVDAQQARRALDYLVGFTLSPVLWRKLPGSRSAGRVQSVALRLICERDEEIERFKSEEYWSIEAQAATSKKENFLAKLFKIGEQKIDKMFITNELQATELTNELKSRQFKIAAIEKKQQNRNTPPPFTTSSLQQEASRKLGFSTKKTMQIAQKLYEGIPIDGETIGLITYMRTDGLYLADDAIKATRALIGKKYGEKYLPKSAKIYKPKAKNAQEAHEAIRPTNIELIPQKIAGELDKDQLKLYDLIWKRTMACQMENAILDLMTVDIISHDGKYTLRANGSAIHFDGFYILYREGMDDATDSDESKMLPAMHEGEDIAIKKVTPNQHFTEPPPRYTEASLVKKMEELGIGRPSTYAPIISVLQERSYVRLEKKRFLSEERGRIVTSFLTSFFERYVEYNFTADLEDRLDKVAEGELNWKTLLGNFWEAFNHNIADVSKISNLEITEKLNELLSDHLFPPANDGADPRQCPDCQPGKLGLRFGKFGAFIACSNYPECKHTRQIVSAETSEEDIQAAAAKPEDKVLGQKEGMDVLLKKGPYGWYVQLGEPIDKKIKPKRSSLPPGYKPEQITFEMAKNLLELPKVLGAHPDSGDEISIGIGKYGPFVKHQKQFVSIPKSLDPFAISYDQAMDLIVKHKKKA